MRTNYMVRRSNSWVEECFSIGHSGLFEILQVTHTRIQWASVIDDFLVLQLENSD